MSTDFDFNDLESLLAHQNQPAVSVYLPTTRITTRIQAESLQFKNLLRDAEELLGQFDLRSPEIRAMLQPAQDLVSDTDFWRHQKDGLAVFISKDSFRSYQVPVSFETGLFVGQAFHLKPLLPLLTNDTPFYLLAVSQNHVRFFECSQFSVEEVDPAKVPDSLQEVLSEYQYDKQMQWHTRTSTPAGVQRGAEFHGQGGFSPEEEKLRIREFFDRIDKGLQEYLHDARAPLVFAGVDYLFPIYREANSYPHLVESSIEGNPDTLKAEELHRRAWKLLEPRFNEDRAAAIEEFYVGLPRDMASVDLKEIVGWADQGRVAAAFVDREASVWGLYDREQFDVEIHQSVTSQNRDLTDLAALFTLLRDGDVYLMTPEQMEMEFGPENRHQHNGSAPQIKERPAVAASYRFAIENPG